jgi:site-specific recombinase XerD
MLWTMPRADDNLQRRMPPVVRVTEVDSLEVNDIGELRRSFEVALRARNRSASTIRSYLEAIDLFRDFAVAAGFPTTVDRVNREHVETFLADQLARWRPKTAQIRYGSLRQFFKWCQEEGEITVSPMVNVKPPTVPEVPIPVVSDDDLRALLKACEGSDLDQRRDTAVLRLFIDCGLRLAEVTNLTVEDVDWQHETVGVVGKGSRPRAVPMSSKTVQALDRYMRLRKKHPQASSTALWLGARGPLTSNGVAQLLRRRCRRAGIDQLHPHQLRHTAAHEAAKSLGDSDMMRIFGWRSRQMLTRYGASAADERAREAYKRLAPGDRV